MNSIMLPLFPPFQSTLSPPSPFSCLLHTIMSTYTCKTVKCSVFVWSSTSPFASSTYVLCSLFKLCSTHRPLCGLSVDGLCSLHIWLWFSLLWNWSMWILRNIHAVQMSDTVLTRKSNPVLHEIMSCNQPLHPCVETHAFNRNIDVYVFLMAMCGLICVYQRLSVSVIQHRWEMTIGWSFTWTRKASFDIWFCLEANFLLHTFCLHTGPHAITYTICAYEHWTVVTVCWAWCVSLFTKCSGAHRLNGSTLLYEH